MAVDRLAPSSLTVLTGPVASGKSRLAAAMGARWAGAAPGRTVEVVATAEALDDEMRERIERHRAERPSDWPVHEAPLDLAGSLEAVDAAALTIVDCLTLWTSNLLGAGNEPEAVVALAVEAAALAAARPGPTVVVTNEVGWGIVPVNASARAYRDVLGRVNGAFVARAASAWLVVAGRVLRLDEPDADEMLQLAIGRPHVEEPARR